TLPAPESDQARLDFGAGITAADLGAEQVGFDLVLHVRGDEGSITVRNWFDGTFFAKIESFVFADGTSLLASDIDFLAHQPSLGYRTSGGGTLAGTQYSDDLTATAYGTVLQGGAGNDMLQ